MMGNHIKNSGQVQFQIITGTWLYTGISFSFFVVYLCCVVLSLSEMCEIHHTAESVHAHNDVKTVDSNAEQQERLKINGKFLLF